MTKLIKTTRFRCEHFYWSLDKAYTMTATLSAPQSGPREHLQYGGKMKQNPQQLGLFSRFISLSPALLDTESLVMYLESHQALCAPT